MALSLPPGPVYGEIILSSVPPCHASLRLSQLAERRLSDVKQGVFIGQKEESLGREGSTTQ